MGNDDFFWAGASESESESDEDEDAGGLALAVFFFRSVFKSEESLEFEEAIDPRAMLGRVLYHERSSSHGKITQGTHTAV